MGGAGGDGEMGAGFEAFLSLRSEGLATNLAESRVSTAAKLWPKETPDSHCPELSSPLGPPRSKKIRGEGEEVKKRGSVPKIRRGNVLLLLPGFDQSAVKALRCFNSFSPSCYNTHTHI